jgi:hypothetical protein
VHTIRYSPIIGQRRKKSVAQSRKDERDNIFELLAGSGISRKDDEGVSSGTDFAFGAISSWTTQLRREMRPCDGP